MGVEKPRFMIATVTHRSCPLCGHREVGLVLEDGSFLRLSPGMTVGIPAPPAGFPWERPETERIADEETEWITSKLWVPEPLRGDKDLRAKYGVMLNERLFKGEMSGDLYETAYLEKLRRLIENQRDVHPAVVLDRYFTSPHLASGDALQVVHAMWRELDEIRAPVLAVRAWLQKGDEESLEGMIRPKTRDTMENEPADDETVMKELEALSLEEFLDKL